MKKTLGMIAILFTTTALMAENDGPSTSRFYDSYVEGAQTKAGETNFDEGKQKKIVEAQSRLAHLKKYFSSKGGSVETVFRSLTNQDSTNTSGQRQEEVSFKTDVSDADQGISAVKCIADNKFVVTSNPQQLNQSATNWHTSTGQSILQIFIDALKGKKDEGIATVTFSEKVSSDVAGVEPSLRQYTAVVASSKWLLGSKNTSNKKFLCYIVVE